MSTPALHAIGAGKNIGGYVIIRHGHLTQLADAEKGIGGLVPGQARLLGEYLIACADAAEPELDPAEVKALRELLRDHFSDPGAATDAVLAILRAGYKPPASTP